MSVSGAKQALVRDRGQDPFALTLHLQKLDRGEVVASFQNFGTDYYGSDVIRKMYNGLLTKSRKWLYSSLLEERL